MSRLDIADRLYSTNRDGQDEQEAPCMWYARCGNPANGVRPHPTFGDVPICQWCDDKVDRLENAS